MSKGGGDRAQPPNVLVFVGASLLANGGGQRALLQAKIRLQASSYKGKRQVFVFVGASLLANGGG